MRAVVYDRYGGPEVLRLAEVPTPIPAEGQVLVRVAATSVNLSDWECLRGSPAYARIGGLRAPARRVLGSDVAGVVGEYLETDLTGFLADHDLKVPDITAWVCHPGGPKILTAIQDALGLHNDELGVTWRSLARIGNLSSSSVLHVLADTLPVFQ